MPRRGRGRGRIVLAAVAVLGFVVAATGMYLVTSSAQKSRTTADCGGYQCIPTLKPSSVVDVLKSKGHDCKEDEYGSSCELRIGAISFETRMESHDGLIESVTARVQRPPGDEKSNATLPYLVWVASMPYSNDAGLTADIKAWVTKQVEGKKSTKASIGGYDYELNSNKPGFIELSFRGKI